MSELLEATRRVAKDALGGFGAHGTSQMAAALAYYSALSVVPLAVVVLVIAGLVVDADVVASMLLGQAESILGADAAGLLDEAVGRALLIEGGVLTAGLGIGAVLFGATNLLLQLQVAMRRVFELEVVSGIRGHLVKRLISLAVIGVLAVALLLTLVVWWTAAAIFPGRVSQAVQGLVSLGVLAAIIAAGYRWLARTDVSWAAVAAGTGLAIAGLWATNSLIGMYFARASVGSVFGAAGALVVVLVWVFIVAQVFLLGAEFVRATENEFARRRSSPA